MQVLGLGRRVEGDRQLLTTAEADREALVPVSTTGPAFAHLSDARADRYGQERHDGVVQVCRALDLPAPATLTVPIDVRAAVEQLQDLQATAVACYNDDVAITLSAAARLLGLQVPGDLALIGMDHTPLGRVVQPPLTTVTYDSTAIAHVLSDQVRTSLGMAARHLDTAAPFSVVQGGTT